MGLSFIKQDDVIHIVIPTGKRNYYKYFQDFNINAFLFREGLVEYFYTLKPETLNALLSRKYCHATSFHLMPLLHQYLKVLKSKSNKVTVEEMYDQFNILLDVYLQSDPDVFFQSCPSDYYRLHSFCHFYRRMKTTIWKLDKEEQRKHLQKLARNSPQVSHIVDYFIEQRTFLRRDRRFLIEYFSAFPQLQFDKYFCKYHGVYNCYLEN